MAQLTIQISDELAGRLEPLQSRLPELLWLLLDIDGEQTTKEPKLNTHKGSDFATIDSTTGEIVPLYNPRRQIWDEHFYFESVRIEGKTQVGQATVKLLQFNLPNRLLQRQVLMSQQKYP